MLKRKYSTLMLTGFLAVSLNGQQPDIAEAIRNKSFNPSQLIWFITPAAKWEEAVPVGNGRLGAMVFGKADEERIQLNEDTYWSGGPYSTVVKGGYKALPEIRELIYKNEIARAHKVFGRNLMGYPVEQQKYQALANLHLLFPDATEVSDYTRWLDIGKGIAGTEYLMNGIKHRREVFSSSPDQVIVVRLTADKPGSITFKASLRGVRNGQMSNYATDYFRMDDNGSDQLVLTGKSADYMGIEGKIRYEARIKAVPEGGKMIMKDAELIIENADAVTLYFVAATNFVSYKDVSADQHQRVEAPSLAGLCYQFGRYLMISSSRPGTQPANLQGIWNQDMNPMWDSKYTTNINTEMNYWPVESSNLSEFSEPLIKMVKELTDQGRRKLVPPQTGKSGALQEWTLDMEQLEKEHRHFSHLYGLYPGNVISAKRTPEYIGACKTVLEQRGDGGTGFSRAWKMALWARLYDGDRANRIFKGYLKEQAYPQLFAKCYTPLQVDGSFGVTAGITEMLIQSHEGVIDLLPALPSEWENGRFNSVCARGAFEISMEWKNKTISDVSVLSRAGSTCSINPGTKGSVTLDGRKIPVNVLDDGTIQFSTFPGKIYLFEAVK